MSSPVGNPGIGHSVTGMIDVVLPCLNEAEALPIVLRRVPPGYRPIVVDNGSTDGSARIARDHGAIVVPARPAGFGAAAHAGLEAATSEVVCFLDADGSLDPGQLPQVVEPVLGGRADLVLGRRRPVSLRAFPIHARLGNQAIAWRLRHLAGVPVYDLGPMRAARRAALLALDLRDRRFGYPLEMVVKAARAGWRVAEVDVDYAPRAGGASKVTGSVLGIVRTVRDMTRVLGE
jgi:glycosyltransferase involved in cell wall biosynthesis